MIPVGRAVVGSRSSLVSCDRVGIWASCLMRRLRLMFSGFCYDFMFHWVWIHSLRIVASAPIGGQDEWKGTLAP